MKPTTATTKIDQRFNVAPVTATAAAVARKRLFFLFYRHGGRKTNVHRSSSVTQQQLTGQTRLAFKL
jgi:hypothetical protein